MSDRLTERALCSECHGNGSVRIPGGVSVCPRCDGRCWEDPALLIHLQAVLIPLWRGDEITPELRMMARGLWERVADAQDAEQQPCAGCAALRAERDEAQLALGRAISAWTGR